LLDIKHSENSRTTRVRRAYTLGDKNMSDVVISVDEFVDAGWYPGFKPEYMDAPWINERAGRFTKADEQRFWFIDFHWPNGFSPMGCIYLEDAYAWDLQAAARGLPLPAGNGLVPRIAGVHVYGSESRPPSAFEIQQRAERIATTLPAFLRDFRSIWAERVRELESGLKHFETLDYQTPTLSELAQILVDARAFNKRAWEIHFEIMYPLLANYLGFYGMCGELGISPVETAKFLQGYDTKMMAC
jgi:pyruvate,water dikinase